MSLLGLEHLPEAERIRIGLQMLSQRATQRTERWMPQKGPQEDFVNSEVKDAFFGGGRGSGKTAALLFAFRAHADKYGEHAHGIIFRKSHPELEEVMKISRQMLVSEGWIWRAGERIWVAPSGATLKLRHIENAADADLYQGHSYCVGVDTLIRMADGTSKRASDVRVGDEVATLEGPRGVTATVAPYEAPCVSMRTRYGEQLAPVWHPVLTSSGWQSFASLSGIYSTRSAMKHREWRNQPSVTCQTLLSLPETMSVSQHDCVPTSGLFPEGLSGSSGSPMVDRSSTHQDLMQQIEWLQSLWGHGTLPQAADDEACVIFGNGTVVSYSDDCWFYTHHSDEQLLVHEGSDQAAAPSRSGVLSPNPIGLPPDGRVCTQQHTHTGRPWYRNPYTGKVREVEESCNLQFGSCSMTPVGDRVVCDFTVEGANHYISQESFLINANTFLGIDEIGTYPTLDFIDMLRACLRSTAGTPTYFRCTGNPGGPGHMLLKHRYVDPAPYGEVFVGDDGVERCYFHSTVKNNPMLLDNDPDYINRIRSSGPAWLVRAWLEGDWNIVAGSYLEGIWDPDVHIVKPFEIPVDWKRFRSGDWGFAKPYSVNWFTVDFDGNLYLYRELYGTNGKHDTGVREDVLTVAQKILRMEEAEASKGIRFVNNPMDSAAWQNTGQHVMSVGEQFRQNGVVWSKAVKGPGSRVWGAQEVVNRLENAKNRMGPALFIFDTCKHAIRLLPAMIPDENNPEDINSDGEAHIWDSVRYGLSSRRTLSHRRKEMSKTKPGSFNWLLDQHPTPKPKPREPWKLNVGGLDTLAK